MIVSERLISHLGNLGWKNGSTMPLPLWYRSIVYQVWSVGFLMALFVGRVDSSEALAQDTPYACVEVLEARR